MSRSLNTDIKSRSFGDWDKFKPLCKVVKKGPKNLKTNEDIVMIHAPYV